MRIVIYTALTGGYDNLIQPHVTNDSFDFVCFSDNIKKSRVGVWRIKPIPINLENKQLLSRYPKMHPHELLDEYDYSLYIDANIEILDDVIYKRVLSLISNKINLAGMWHHEVDCAYEEGLRVLTSGKEKDWKNDLALMRYLKREGFPYHFGMYEANCIFRNHHNRTVIAQCELWWNCFIKYAHRDQLSFSYTLWKYQIPFHYILPKGENTRNSNHIYAGAHSNPSPFWKKQMKKILYKPTVFVLKIWINITKNVS